jgi:hypothetical protein
MTAANSSLLPFYCLLLYSGEECLVGLMIQQTGHSQGQFHRIGMFHLFGHERQERADFRIISKNAPKLCPDEELYIKPDGVNSTKYEMFIIGLV